MKKLSKYTKASELIKDFNLVKIDFTHSYYNMVEVDNIQTLYQLMQDEIDNTKCYLVVQKRDLTKWDNITQSYGKLCGKTLFYHNIECDIDFNFNEEMENEVKIEVLESEKENLTKTIEDGNDLISQAKEIVEWLISHNKNYTKTQYYKLLDLQNLLNGD